MISNLATLLKILMEEWCQFITQVSVYSSIQCSRCPLEISNVMAEFCFLLLVFLFLFFNHLVYWKLADENWEITRISRLENCMMMRWWGMDFVLSIRACKHNLKCAKSHFRLLQHPHVISRCHLPSSNTFQFTWKINIYRRKSIPSKNTFISFHVLPTKRTHFELYARSFLTEYDFQLEEFINSNTQKVIQS